MRQPGGGENPQIVTCLQSSFRRQSTEYSGHRRGLIKHVRVAVLQELEAQRKLEKAIPLVMKIFSFGKVKVKGSP